MSFRSPKEKWTADVFFFEMFNVSSGRTFRTEGAVKHPCQPAGMMK